MSGHLRYLWYVTRHRWFVFLECCKLRIPWRGLVHDLSKYHPSEWFPYVEKFGGGIRAGRNKDGSYDPTAVSDRFTAAWFHHQKSNAHHWQYYLLPLDNGGFTVMDMPLRFRKEMVADWRGAGRAQGTPGVLNWYQNNKGKMLLHPDTREWVEREIGYEG